MGITIFTENTKVITKDILKLQNNYILLTAWYLLYSTVNLTWRDLTYKEIRDENAHPPPPPQKKKKNQHRQKWTLLRKKSLGVCSMAISYLLLEGERVVWPVFISILAGNSLENKRHYGPETGSGMTKMYLCWTSVQKCMLMRFNHKVSFSYYFIFDRIMCVLVTL